MDQYGRPVDQYGRPEQTAKPSGATAQSNVQQQLQQAHGVKRRNWQPSAPVEIEPPVNLLEQILPSEDVRRGLARGASLWNSGSDWSEEIYRQPENLPGQVAYGLGSAIGELPYWIMGGKVGGKVLPALGRAAKTAYTKRKMPPVDASKRIQESAGQSIFPDYRTYIREQRKWMEDAVGHKMSHKDIVKELRDMGSPSTPRQFLADRARQMDKYIETPLKPYMQKVFKMGGQPYTSNYHGTYSSEIGPSNKYIMFYDQAGKHKTMYILDDGSTVIRNTVKGLIK